MLSLHTTIESFERKSLEDRLLEQAIAAHKLSAEQFSAIVEVFNREHLSIKNFWNYVTAKKMEYGERAAAVADAMSEVLNIEEFNNLIDNDITWVN